jgi:hypothetical protein
LQGPSSTSLKKQRGRAKTPPVVANEEKLKSAYPPGDSSGISSTGKEDNTNSLSPDKADPSAPDDKNNPHCADAKSVDSIQPGAPFPNHDLSDLSEY